MRNEILKRQKVRHTRSMRIRRKVRGTSTKPRMCVVKTNNHIQVQLIDDEAGTTLASAATFSKEFKGTEFGKKNKASAKKLGEKIAELATTKNIKEVVFDRGPFKYHGILAELAEAARAGGLQF